MTTTGERGQALVPASAQVALIIASAAALAYFLYFFREAIWQPTVDLAWFLAVVCFALAWWRREQPAQPHVPQPLWFYALYAAILLPFATNWRWAMAADTLTWPMGGLALAERGPPSSLLSVNGADNFGYLQMALHSIFMVLVKPTLFWHRFGKILVATCALASVYTVFARVIAPTFGILVAACAASTSVWIVYTYASYPFLDGIASAYALVAIGLWVRREPDSRRAWVLLGLLSGFMLFLTPNSWFMALCVWTWLGVQTLYRRWGLLNPIIAVVLGLITGLPMMIQWSHGQGGQLFSLVQNPGWTTQKVTAFLTQAATIPFASDIQGAGAFGPQLPLPFRWFFIPGILLTPIFAKRFPGARFFLGIYLVQVAILAFSQGPYAGVSVKRALMLIPMATYFLFLPIHRYLRSLPLVLLIIAAWASFGVYDVVARMQPGRTGYTLLDGVVEANQRFSDVPVCIMVTKDQFVEPFLPGSEVDRLYHLAPHVKHVHDPADPACQSMLCYSPQIDQLDLAALGYTEIPMLSSVELRCGRKG